MLEQKYIPLLEYENSTVKDAYHYLYEKNDELVGDNITEENEGEIIYGKDIINCKVIHSRQ